MSQIIKTSNVLQSNSYPQQNKQNKYNMHEKTHEKDIVVTVVSVQTDYRGQILDIRA